MSLAVFSLIAAAGLTTIVTQNIPPASPPASPLGQPAPTSTVPSGGVTINAATGAVVTNAAAGATTNITGRTNVATRPAAPGVGASTAGRSNITPVQLQNINRLAIDLNALGIASRNPAERQRALIENLNAAPLAAVRPAADSVAKLGASLASVIPSLNLTAAQRRQLAIDLNLALNSGNLTAEEAQRVITDARNLLQPSAVKNPDGVEQLLNALGGIVAEVHAGRQSVTQPPDQGLVDQSGAQSTSGESSSPAEVGQSPGAQSGQESGASVPPEP